MRTTQPDNKAIYDHNWDSWEEMKRFGPMSRHTQRLVLRQCRSLAFGSVLDIGCGPGVFLSLLKKHFPGISCAGTDISAAAISLARKNLPEGDFFEMDISAQKPHTQWDLVTMIDVAEHIEKDTEAFKNIRTVCNKYLLIATLEGTMRSFEPEIGHVRNYKPGELQSKLADAGYTVVRYMHWGFPLYSPMYRDLSKGIGAHTTVMTPLRRLVARLVYYALFCQVPGCGDLVITVASPAGKGKNHG